MPPLNSFNKSCIAVAVSQLLSMSTNAATITVNSNTDDGVGCTLREAVASANTTVNQNNGCQVGSAAGTDMITFSNDLTSNTIILSPGQELVVDTGKDIEINASQIAGGITISDDNEGRVRSVISVRSLSSLVLNNLTVANGNSDGIEISVGTRSSGDMDSRTTNVSLIDSIVTNNAGIGIDVALNGSFSATPSSSDVTNDRYGILNLTLTNSTVTDNSGLGSHGISIYNITSRVNFRLIDSTVSGFRGNGIDIGSVAGLNDITLVNSTVSGNGSSSSRGIFLENDTARTNSFAAGSTNILTLNNSTISGDSVGSTIGGVGLFITNGTVQSNRNPEIYFSNFTDVRINNSILANSNNGGDCVIADSEALGDVFVTVDSASIIEDGSCGANRSGDPGLLDLADNGGIGQTHALSANSIARNSSVGVCEATDQLGQVRDISDGFCDVGAVEFDPALPGANADNATTSFSIPLSNGKTVIFGL